MFVSLLSASFTDSYRNVCVMYRLCYLNFDLMLMLFFYVTGLPFAGIIPHYICNFISPSKNDSQEKKQKICTIQSE